MSEAIASRAAYPSTSWHLASETTGIDYELTVELPNRYPGSDKNYPLVVCLDGLWTYGIVRDAFRILPLGRELPEAVILGVTHADPDVRAVLQQRAVDFTPTKAAAPTETGVRLPADEVGKAAGFRRLLLDTIVPSVVERFRINDDRTLVGHSFSALFGVDTLFSEPEAFSRWVLASPSVWWDDRVMFQREADHAAALAKAGNTLRATVFMSAGSLEGGDEGYGGHELFYRQLSGRGHHDLDLRWADFPGETHQSVIAPSLVRGLRNVFA